MVITDLLLKNGILHVTLEAESKSREKLGQNSNYRKVKEVDQLVSRPF